jgi:hypothetical protein
MWSPTAQSAKYAVSTMMLLALCASGAAAQAEPAPNTADKVGAAAAAPPAEAPQAPTNSQAQGASPAPAPAPAPVIDAADEEAIRRALAQDSTSDGPADDGVPTASSTPPAPAGAGLQSLIPDLAFIADFALAYFSEDENLQSGGHDPVKNGFNLQQLELSVGAAVDPYFRFDANIVFGQFGVEVEEAYATTLALPEHLQLRAGQFLTRFGRLNATHPHGWDFVDQPFALGRVFGAEGNRGLGTELSWLSPLPWYVELVASITDAGGEATARSFYGPEDLGVASPFDLQSTVAIKQFFPLSEDWSLAWGLSGASGPNPTGRDNRSEVYGTDLYLKWRPISFQSDQYVALHTEWLYRRRQVPEAVLQDVSCFSSVVFRFARRWAVAGRYEYGSPAVDAGFDEAPDYLDPEWDAGRTRASINTTFWPTELSRLRLQGSVDMPEWETAPIWATFIALEVVTGAHGAHQF